MSFQRKGSKHGASGEWRWRAFSSTNHADSAPQCREGTGWSLKKLRRIESGEGAGQDLETLAGGALWVACALRTQFRADYEAHITAHRCSFAESFEE